MSFHIDLKSFINIFEIPWNQLSRGQKLDFLHMQSDSERKSVFRRFKNSVLVNNPLITHEYFHFWQGFTYPFLYLVECLTYQFYTEKIKSIRNSKNNKIPPHDYDAYASEIPFSVITKERTSIKTDSGDIQWEVMKNENLFKQPLSIYKLIEGAASLYQYKIYTIHREFDSGNPKGFKIWMAKNRSYTDAYNYMIKRLGEELSFFAFIPLINAAFYTSDPLLGFLTAINGLSEITQKRKREMIENGVNDFFETLLTSFDEQLEHLFVDNGVIKNENPTILKYFPPQEQQKIPTDHPVLSPFRNKWFSGIFEDPNHEHIFLDVFSIEHFTDLIINYRPPISAFVIKDSPINDKVISGIIFEPSTIMREDFRVILGIHSLYNFMDAIFSKEKKNMTNKACPWINCKYFKTGLCKGHLNPPSTSNNPEINCSFPKLIEGVQIDWNNFLNQKKVR